MLSILENKKESETKGDNLQQIWKSSINQAYDRCNYTKLSEKGVI